MKAVLVLGTLAVLVAIATGDVSTFTQNQQAALTTIDTVPSRAQLQQATLSVPDDLITVAINAEQRFEPGVRLRAIHGLAIYSVYCTTPGNTCPDLTPVHTTLADLITANTDAHSGSDLLILRAAVESIGPLKVPGDLGALTGLLNHASRDIRAAAARAIAGLEKSGCGGINALRVRYQNESTDQVKLVISETLRILSQVCSS